LREQTQAARAAEPAAVYEGGIPPPRHPLPSPDEAIEGGGARSTSDPRAALDLPRPGAGDALDAAGTLVDALGTPVDDPDGPRGVTDEPHSVGSRAESAHERDLLADGTRPVPVPRFFTALRYLGQLDL